MAFSEDLGAFFSDSEFAVQATLTPGGPGLVIYDENGAVAESYNVQGSGPVALCPASQWPTLAIGDTLAIGAASYLVRAALRIEDGALVLLTLARTT